LSVSGANCLPARCFVRSPTRWKSLGSIPPTDLWLVGALCLVGCRPAPPHSQCCAQWFPSLGPLIKSIDGKQFATDADTKPTFATCYRHLALISCMLGYKPRHHDGTYLNVKVTVEVWIWFVAGIIFNNGDRIKKVTATYAVSCELDICSNNAGMVFYNKVLGMNHFQSHLFFLFCLML
jgi:hypothetical protein